MVKEHACIQCILNSLHQLLTIIIDSVFGCELHKLCERENTNVPKFLVKFIEHIERRGLDVVGIYRLSGNAASVTKLRYLVEQGKILLCHCFLVLSSSL